MTSQDTYHKLKHNLYAGMKLEHKFRRGMGGQEYNWYCIINEIDEESNKLKVTIQGMMGYSHPEDWDMAITVGGLADGEYLEIE